VIPGLGSVQVLSGKWGWPGTRRCEHQYLFVNLRFFHRHQLISFSLPIFPEPRFCRPCQIRCILRGRSPTRATAGSLLSSLIRGMAVSPIATQRHQRASVPALPCEARTPVPASCFLFPLRSLPPPVDLVLRVELFCRTAVSVREFPTTRQWCSGLCLRSSSNLPPPRSCFCTPWSALVPLHFSQVSRPALVVGSRLHQECTTTLSSSQHSHRLDCYFVQRCAFHSPCRTGLIVRRGHRPVIQFLL
jgi:hypothetical protein